MPFDRLPETTQTLYAELLEQSIHAAAAQAAIAAPSGSFVRKHIKGRTYWYLQRLEGKHKRQHYLGPDSDTLRAWIQGIKDQHSIARDDRQRRQQLCSMLATGGAVRETAAMIQVLQILSEAGVFRWGGVLVGTQAFAALANLLGVRFDRQALRTQDIDVAQDPAIGIALAPSGDTEDVAEALTESKLGFHPIPEFDPRDPSTSFKVRGRDLRVDFLTPLRGPESSKPIFLPAFRVAAQPLRFLDYLIEQPAQAVIVGGSGILVNVPDPARFALHKLWTSQRRPVSEQAKVAKDLRQSELLIEVLLADRPQDLVTAWEALGAHKSIHRLISKALDRLRDDLREPLQAAIAS